MSSSITELRDLHAAYTRLTDKFKTLWTFHQFLQGIHKNFMGDAPGYQVDFQAQYDQIKNVTSIMTFQPPPVVLDTINRLDSQLEAILHKQSEADKKVAPNLVRRFFEKVRTEDEKLLMTILRFYFSNKFFSRDMLDKVDFLITLVGARRSIDDGRYLARFPIELQKLFGGFLALSRRQPADSADVERRVAELIELKTQIETCSRFEDLSEKKLLEKLRKVKHELGPTYFNVDVLSAILEANLAAKNKFIALYDEEEQRILDSSRQLLEMEKEIENNPRFKGEELQEEFRKFRQYKEEFEKSQKDGAGVRHGEVTRLAESIDQLLAKLQLPQDPGKKPASAGDDTASRRQGPAMSLSGAMPGMVSSVLSSAGGQGQLDRSRAVLTTDALLGEQASKILYSVELIDSGTGSGKAAYHRSLGRLRLEPWEVRAARRISSGEISADEISKSKELLFFEAAALRTRIDEEAQAIKGGPNEGLAATVTDEKLAECARCLMRAQEVDRRFRMAIEEATGYAPPEKLNELHRSRFRLLRAFSGLWLLHNLRVGV